MDRTREPEFRRAAFNLMSASYHTAYDESSPLSSLVASRTDTNHRSYHALPRKLLEETPNRPLRPISLSSESYSISSNVSIPTITAEYTFTSDEHPNYTNMMNDNHLIDSCTEAQQDIRDRIALNSCSASVSSEYGNRVLGLRSRPPSAQNNVMSLKDTVFNAQKLQQWMSYMERYVEAVSPSRSEVLRMTSFERKTRLKEQVDLRKYIASYDGMVKRFVKSATCASSHQAGISVKNLEEKYLMLLLQAIEAQCLLEGYPGMRNGSVGCLNNDEDDSIEDDAVAGTLGTRFVEGKCSSPANAFNFYCLNDQSTDEKYSEYSYDSVDGLLNRPSNLRDELLDVIGESDATSSSGQDSMVERVGPVTCPERLSIDTIKAADQPNHLPTAWSKKKVNRWLHFQPTHKSNKLSSSVELNQIYPAQDSHEKTASSPQTQCSRISPTDSGRLSATSESSTEQDQHWDHYQELYSTVNSSVVDLSTAEELLHFGDNYSDLLRPCDENNSLAASSVSLSEFFHDESNAQAQLDDSFLLSGLKKSLPMSALKTIDDIFDFTELQTHAGTSGGLEWIEPTWSPRRSPSGTSCSKSTVSSSSSSVQNDPKTEPSQTDTTSNNFSSIDTGQTFTWSLNDAEDTSRSLSLESLAEDINDMTLVPQLLSPSCSAHTSSVPTKPSRRVVRKLILPKRIIRRVRRRTQPPAPSFTSDQLSQITAVIHQSLTEMRQEDVQLILNTCQTYLECLNHVLLGQTVNTIVQQPAVDLAQCLRPVEHCRCGIIARFVQSVVDFLLDYANCFRHFVLYKLFVRTMHQMFRMVRTIGEGVKRHRLEMGSIEFVL